MRVIFLSALASFGSRTVEALPISIPYWTQLSLLVYSYNLEIYFSLVVTLAIPLGTSPGRGRLQLPTPEAPQGHLRWPPPSPELHQSHPLTMALGIAVVAQATAVTVGAIELWPAQAAASVVTTLGEGPHGAAATHCRPRVHGSLSRQPRPSPTPACPLGVPYSRWQRGKWK